MNICDNREIINKGMFDVIVVGGVIVESVDGKEFFGAKAVVDATGDASIMHRAGVPTVVGENYMTYIAHMYDKKAAEDLSENDDVCAFLILSLIRIICCSDIPRHILIFERCYLVIFLKGLYKIGTA